MTQEFLDNVELYVLGTMKDYRQKARYSHEHGFHEVARQHENTVALAEKVLEEIKNA
jgi:hypothetical protein